MSKNKTTIRFAFGTQENPASAIWRVHINHKTGDVYIHNTPSFSGQVHIALHASGKFSFKCGPNIRHHLQPPLKAQYLNIWQGPSIQYQRGHRNLPPPPLSGNVDKVHWLGWPEEKQIMSVTMFYHDLDIAYYSDEEGTAIAFPIQAAIFKRPMLFQMVKATRPLSESEIARKPEVMTFNGEKLPTDAEIIRLSKSDEGTSVITIEQFHAKLSK